MGANAVKSGRYFIGQIMARVSDTQLEQYLRDIRVTPLLTAEEEITLSRRIHKGDKEAREHMIRANLRLVVSIAKDFLNRGLPFMDLIAEGNIGLMRGIEKFDPELGFRFSTYGVHWIKQSIRRALVNSSKTVRIPSYMVEIVSQFKQKSAEIAAANGGKVPPPTEVAKIIGLSDDQLEMMRAALNSHTHSADFKTADGEASLVDMIADQRFPDPAELAVTQCDIEMISELLEGISEREARVLRMRFGIGMPDPMTLSEIGEQEGLTRERIRQIENGALRTLGNIISKKRGYSDEIQGI